MKRKFATLAALALALVLAMSSVPLFSPMAVEAATVQSVLENPEFVPIRAIFEEAGGEVIWVNEDRSIHIFADGGSIVLFVEQPLAIVNDVPVELEQGVVLENNTSFMHIDELMMLLDIFMETLFDSGDFLVFYLTEEARDLVLYDFDFIVDVILENTPWESVLNRRFDMDFAEYIVSLREIIYGMEPFTFPIPISVLEELFEGEALEDVLFPIRGTDDPRDMAADYLSYFLFLYMGIVFEGIGHLGPRDIGTYRIQYSIMRRVDYSGEVDYELDPASGMRFGIFTHPDVIWFYGETEVDMDADILDDLPEIEGNIVAEILIPGEVAYLAIGTFMACPEFDELIIIPFLEEVQDFEHLILDLRGNPGGMMFYFPSHIFSRLITEPVEFTSHEFFSSGEIAVSVMEAWLEMWENMLTSEEWEEWAEYYSVEIMPADEFILQREMTAFNQDDLTRLDYVLVSMETLFPVWEGPWFEGKVWLLIDANSASASSHATLMLMGTGRATVVGDNSSGVMGSQHTYIVLPNTGMLFRIDIGYMTDIFGNSLEAYGIAPHVRNFEGMDALETVLELIAQGEF